MDGHLLTAAKHAQSGVAKSVNAIGPKSKTSRGIGQLPFKASTKTVDLAASVIGLSAGVP
jgi:hypothetical protein